MTDAQQIELEALITEREGMLAENAHRMHVQGGVAYGDLQFAQLADRIRALATPEPETKRGQWCARQYHLGDYLGVICTDDSMALYRCGHRLDRDSPLMRIAVEAAVDALESHHE